MRLLAVTNLYPTVAAPAQGTFVKQQLDGIARAGVTIELLYVNRGAEGPRAYARLPRMVREAVDRVQPDVVHVFYGGVMAAIATRAVRDRPVVVTFYGNDLLGTAPGSGLVQSLRGRIGVLASRLAARRADGVIVQSRVMAKALRTEDEYGLWIIPDGVDLDVFAPRDPAQARRERGWSEDRRHVLFPAARTRRRKRYGLAAAAVEQLDETSEPTELHELVGVEHGAVADWLNASDAVVLTSTHEGSPNVIKEALACNVPVVSVDVGDVRELIDGIPGCSIVDPDPRAIAQGLRRAFAGGRPDEARLRMAELSYDRIGERLRGVYEAVTEPGAPASLG